MPQSPLIQLQQVTKTYFRPDGGILVEALRGVDLSIDPGEYLAIMGPSGSGKSTLMNLLGCLDQPTDGIYQLDGERISDLDDHQLSRIRGKKIGFVFQAFNLISEMSIVENVEVPLFYQGVSRQERRQLAIEHLDKVGLSDRLTHRPRELSGGQQQRVAIARALVTSPTMVLADEPTGNLDSKTGLAILKLLDELHEQGLTILTVTHDNSVADRCDRSIHLKDGLIDRDVPKKPKSKLLANGADQ
ncbi:MAG: ABC transporter ATP-binding protein [Phycisphaerales bacterium]|nr:ABC transporter ATP-binding protein [Phycisphaerales bacterium]